MSPDVFMDALVERLSARDIDGDMSIDFSEQGTLMLVSPRGTVHVGEERDGGVTWTLWQDDEPITTDGVSGLSDHDLSEALRSIGQLLGV